MEKYLAMLNDLLAHFNGNRAELARQLKLNNAETLRMWVVRGKIPDWRLESIEKLHKKHVRSPTAPQSAQA